MRIQKQAQSCCAVVLGTLFLCSSGLQAKEDFKIRRNIRKDIAQCEFLQSMKDGEWKKVETGIKDITDQYVEAGNISDYEAMSTVFHGKEYIFGIQVTHLELPRWILLIRDASSKRAVYRYAGLVKSSGYDVDQVALSAEGCASINLIGNIVPKIDISNRLYGIMYKTLSELYVDDGCEGKSFATIVCNTGSGGIPPPFSQVITIESVIPIENASFDFIFTKGECALYEGRIVNALKHLYSLSRKDSEE